MWLSVATHGDRVRISGTMEWNSGLVGGASVTSCNIVVKMDAVDGKFTSWFSSSVTLI